MSELSKVNPASLNVAIDEARRVIGTPIEDEVLAQVRQLLLDLQSAVNVDIFMAEFIEAARGGPAE